MHTTLWPLKTDSRYMMQQKGVKPGEWCVMPMVPMLVFTDIVHWHKSVQCVHWQHIIWEVQEGML